MAEPDFTFKLAGYRAATFVGFCGAFWTLAEAVDSERLAKSWNPQTAVECSSPGWKRYEKLDVTETGLTETQILDIRARIASGACRPRAPGQV
jgi:hypothetical protein